MTEQDMQNLMAIADSLQAQPLSWDDLPEEYKQTVIALLEPKPSFTPEQVDFLQRWWMEVDDEKLAAINADMPEGNVVQPRTDTEGKRFISADLFTDVVLPGSRLEPILSHLLGLTLVYRPAETWPVSEGEE
jgi:hypothetical protein